MKDLLKNWNKFKKELIDNFPQDVISEFEQPIEEKKILTREEEADEIIKRLATHPAPPESKQAEYIRKVIIPMIRKVEPKLIAAEIIGVQPMFNYKKDNE